MSSLQQFIRSTDGLIQFDAEFDDRYMVDASQFSIEVHRDEMKSIWEKVKSVYEKCLAELYEKHDASDDQSNVQETITSRYQTAYATYVRFISRLNSHIQQHANLHSLNITQNVQQEARPLYSMHLPPCDTDIFKGDYHSWPTFRDLFTALYINNPRLSKIEKLFHLNRNTTGEAKDIVQKCLPTDEGFDMAWANLKTRYENKRLLVSSQLNMLFSLSKIDIESCDEIKNIQRSINSCISALKSYKVDINSWDPIFIHICANRLPEITLSIWEQSITNRTELQKWSQMDNFLTNRYQTLECVSEVKRTSFNNSMQLRFDMAD